MTIHKLGSAADYGVYEPKSQPTSPVADAPAAADPPAGDVARSANAPGPSTAMVLGAAAAGLAVGVVATFVLGRKRIFPTSKFPTSK